MKYKPSWWDGDRRPSGTRLFKYPFAPCDFKYAICEKALLDRTITDEQVLWLDSHVCFMDTFKYDDYKYITNRLRAIRGMEPI